MANWLHRAFIARDRPAVWVNASQSHAVLGQMPGKTDAKEVLPATGSRRFMGDTIAALLG